MTDTRKKGMTIDSLYELCHREILNGNGKRHILISGDDEGNSYHELFYGFERVDFKGFYMRGTLPFGVTAEEVDEEYIVLG